MTVQEMVDFISKYSGDTVVTMLQCAGDNPLTDDISIREVLGMERSGGGQTFLVIIPD